MCMLKPKWEPPGHVFLANDDVHVWRATMDLPPPAVRLLEQTLAPEERMRAARFRWPIDRMHFVVRRGVLRALLGQYLRREPATLRFHYNRYGKPALAETFEGDAISITFSLSHSRGLALYAITRGRPIGIDLEYVDTEVAYERIAEHLFSLREVDALRALPPQMRREAFFRCWTRKEAYLKARGVGLSLALSQFDVSVYPRRPAANFATAEQSQDMASWSLQDLTIEPDYVASLAREGQHFHLCCWQYPQLPTEPS